MEKNRILLTGSTGFIGKNISNFFNKKYILLSPSSVELNLLDSEAVCDFIHKENINTVIHSAAVGAIRKNNNSRIFFDNVQMFNNILRVSDKVDRIIIFGSGAEYSKDRSIVNVKENKFDEYVPKDEYGFGKYIISKMMYNKKNIVNLRLFGVYGKYEDYKVRFISNVICKALLDIPITINQNVYFDYLYIDDFINILDNVLNKKELNFNIYNVGRGIKVDLYTIAQKVLYLLEKNELPIIVRKKGLNLEYTCSVDRLKKEFTDIKYTQFDETLKRLIDYYKNIINTLNKEDFL